MIEQHFTLRNKELMFHISIWLFVLSSVLIKTAWQPLFMLGGVLFIILTLMVPIYINALILIPRYLKKSTWFNYILLFSLVLFATNIIRALINASVLAIPPETRFVFQDEFARWAIHDFESFDAFVFSNTAWVVYMSFAYKIGKDWVVSERVKEKLTSEKLTMELALLKSQVNPHFLFNTLNNVYSMALEEKATVTADSISKLGSLMRYSLHDIQADFISLDRELNCINRYLDMQRLRMTKGQTLNIEIDDTNAEDFKIAPMILMPLIENASKYGLSTTYESSIDLKIELKNDMLSMDLKNTINVRSKFTLGGLGLKNVKNRLVLLYPDHELSCGQDNGFYNVKLELKLTK